MGALAKALQAPSAYSVKRDKPGLWAELVDQIDAAMFEAELVEIEDRMEFRPLDLPGGWAELLAERIERKREELREEDIGSILRDRYDFT